MKLKKCFFKHKKIIVIKMYRLDDFFKDKRLKNFEYFKFSSCIHFFAKISNKRVLIKKIDLEIRNPFHVFEKKACLVCESNLDEFENGIQYYNGKLNKWLSVYLEEKRNLEKAIKICKKTD